MTWNVITRRASGLIKHQDQLFASGDVTVGTVIAAGTVQTSTGDTTVSVAIPDITISVGQTIDLVALYVTDPLELVTDSQVLNLDTAYATYTHAGGLVGVLETPVAMPNLYLEVTYT